MDGNKILKDALYKAGLKYDKVLIEMVDPVMYGNNMLRTGPIIGIEAYFMCSKCLAIKKSSITLVDYDFNFDKSIEDTVETLLLADIKFSEKCDTCVRYGKHDVKSYEDYLCLNILEVIKLNSKYNEVSYVGCKREKINGQTMVTVHFNCPKCFARNKLPLNEFYHMICKSHAYPNSFECCESMDTMNATKLAFTKEELESRSIFTNFNGTFTRYGDKVVCPNGHITIVGKDMDHNSFKCGICNDREKQLFFKCLPKMKLPYIIVDDTRSATASEGLNGLMIKVFTNYGRFAGIFTFADPEGLKDEYAKNNNLVHRRIVDQDRLRIQGEWMGSFIGSMPYFIDAFEKADKEKARKKAKK